jgi:hypothetical protein
VDGVERKEGGGVMDYDTWRTNGATHECPRGVSYSDSDGDCGCACCEICEAHFAEDDENLIPFDGLDICKSCFEKDPHGAASRVDSWYKSRAWIDERLAKQQTRDLLQMWATAQKLHQQSQVNTDFCTQAIEARKDFALYAISLCKDFGIATN